MPFYTKRPVRVEAHQWFKNGDHPLDGGGLTEGDIVRYYRRPEINGDEICNICGRSKNDHGWIDTLKEGHTVCPGDYIITGVKGDMYPCKPDIFEMTYDICEE